jgi:hypothetical protein
VILCDVNVILHALMEQSAHHAVCKRELERARQRPREMAVSDLVLSAVLRIATNPRIFQPAPDPEEVFPFLEALRAPAQVRNIGPGPKHWTLFRDLVRVAGVRGSDTTDAYLAALAIEHGCEWWTTDGDFGRFPGLRWRNLLA